MLKSIKKIVFRTVGLENYLRILQRSYFFSYKVGLLKNNPEYTHHYFVKNLIKKGDTVLDIGANLGYYSVLFSKWVGEDGRVYSVEPIGLYNKIFREAASGRENITLLPYALGLEEKEVILVSSPKVGYLRTGLPHVYDSQHDGSIEEQEYTFRAEMRVPSQLFGSMDRLDYIKCDIEGFEYTVLSNMKEIIATHKPKIQVEVWQQNEAAINGLLSEIGYTAYRLHNKKLVRNDSKTEGLRGDYIFIHNNDIGSVDKSLL